MSEKITSALLQSPNGGLFSTLQVDGAGIVIKNASDDQRSDGTFVPAGSDTLVLSAVGESSFLNASYMKVGVLDASLLRTGLLQTVASWNSKWYGSAEDSMDVQQGFSGGKFAATSISTTTNSVTLSAVESPTGANHNITTGDYVRVSGLIFGDDTYGNVGVDSPGVGVKDYAEVTDHTSTSLTYELTGVGSGKTTLDPYALPFVSKVVPLVSISRVYDDEVTNENPGELSKVTVVTASAHGLSEGNYVELAGVEDSLNGVWRVSGAPDSTTFEFWQRFVEDIDWEDDGSISLPEYGAPVAIEVSKSYRVTSDGTLMAYGAVFNPAGTRRSAILLRGGGTQGDIAVPADETLQIGYRDGAGGLGGTFTSIMTINTPASGNQGATVINGSLTVDTLTATTINGGTGTASVPDDITAHTITTTAGNIRIRPYENDGSAADKRGELEFYTQIASTGYYTSRVMAFSDKDYGNALVIDPDLRVLGDAQVVGDLAVSGALTAGSFSIGTLNATTVNASSGYYNYLDVGNVATKHAVIQPNGQLTVNNDTNSTSANTGAVVIKGGAYVAQDLRVAGSIYVSVFSPDSITMGVGNNIISQGYVSASAGYYGSMIVGTGVSSKMEVGVSGQLTLNNSTAATSVAGALYIPTGGIRALTGNIGTLTVTSTFSPASLSISGGGGISVTGGGDISTTSSATATTMSATNGYYLNFAAGSTTKALIGLTGQLTVQNTATSTSKSGLGATGSVVVAGDVSVAKKIWAADLDITGSLTGGFTLGAITPSSVVSSYGYYTSLNGTTLSMGSSTATTIGAAGKVTIANTTAAVSTTSGALEVAGGVGITGNLHVGGSINGTITLPSTISASSGYYQTLGSTTLDVGSVATGTRVTIGSGGVLTVTNVTQASSTGPVGSIVTSGGVYIAKDLVVGGSISGTITLPSTITLSSVVSSYGYYTNLNGTALSIGSSTAATISSAGKVTIANTAIANSTTSGALEVAGGVGITGNLHVGGSINGTITLPSAPTFSGTVTANKLQASTGYYSGALTAGAISAASIDATGAISGDTLQIGGTTTNATITTGGAISAVSIDASGALSGSTLSISGNGTVDGNLTISGTLTPTTTGQNYTGDVTVGRETAGTGTPSDFGVYVNNGGTVLAATTRGGTANSDRTFVAIFKTTSGSPQSADAVGVYNTPNTSSNTAARAGGLTLNASGVVGINGASDYRLKENIIDASSVYDWYDIFKSLKVRQFNWKGNSISAVGYIAHEVQSVLPELVVGEKDAVDENGGIVPQSLNLLDILPHVVGALGKIVNHVEQLEARIAELEGNAA